MLVNESNLSDIPRRFIDKFMIEFGHHDYEVRKNDAAEICTLEEPF